MNVSQCAVASADQQSPSSLRVCDRNWYNSKSLFAEMSCGKKTGDRYNSWVGKE
ncbi:hypothetical protein HCU40_08695 [Pseudanabaena biceps]|nr:hypothetical protein [Pseudanabaena biceps]